MRVKYLSRGWMDCGELTEFFLQWRVLEQQLREKKESSFAKLFIICIATLIRIIEIGNDLAEVSRRKGAKNLLLIFAADRHMAEYELLNLIRFCIESMSLVLSCITDL